MPLKIVLIEDSLLMQQTLAAALGELVGVTVVGRAADERAGIELIRRQRPDLAILDLELQSGSGLGVLQALSMTPELFGRPRAVVFSNHHQPMVRARCYALGVDSFFDKGTQLADLLAYVRAAAPG